MSQPFFQFKQFTVWHDKCAMKVGTDGVLLGAWTPVESSARILDIGTGTGLVALMLAQRCSASVIALEIDGKAAQQAAENITRSPWGSRIEVVCQDFRLYSNKNNSLKYDTIVSNPPYFTDSLKCPDSQRNTARHNDNLSYEELLKLGSDKYTVKLKSFPSGINQIRIVPEQVDFLIEQITSNGD